MREYRVFGPPGTGKTTSLLRNIERAIDRFGASAIMVSSFTRAAAREIIVRLGNTDIPKNQVGTLHSICFHALGEPDIAELKLKEFNEAYPGIAVSTSGQDPDDPLASDVYAAASQGDKLLQRMSLERTRLIPREAWPEMLLHFARLWDDWKAQTGYLDFTDLLEHGYRNLEFAPGLPQVMFNDEAQDYSALQFAIVRRWSKYMEYSIYFGDDDQTLYRFSGADPAHLINDDIPPDQKRVLSKSYRVPKVIHKFSSDWIKHCSSRYDKTWSPTGLEGEIKRLSGAHFKAPNSLIDAVEDYSERGKTVMLLASCGFVLQPAIAQLRQRGLAFHNPYRENRGDWNPWNTSTGSTVGRVAAFLKTDEGGLGYRWTYNELKLWSGLIKAKGALKHGAKKLIAEKAKDSGKLVADHYFLAKVLGEGPWQDAFHPWSDRERLFAWLNEAVMEPKRKHLDYVTRALKRDPDLMSPYRKPRIIVGSVHSVKGGESDVVALFPDLSREAAVAWQRGGVSRDSVIRTFYVGMTRARETLLLPRNYGPLHVRM